MRITIGENTKKKMKILGIKEYPFSETSLKKSYRNLIQTNHPDKGGCEEKAKAIIEAYNTLKNLAINDVTSTDKIEEEIKLKKQEEDIFAIFEKCDLCNGTGIINFCPYCNNTGIIEVEIKYEKEICTKCKGTGKIEIKPFNPVIRKGAVMI